VILMLILHATGVTRKFIPIPEGKNANVSSSDNYCSITLGSVFGRMFDNFVRNRYDSMLTSSLLKTALNREASLAQYFFVYILIMFSLNLRAHKLVAILVIFMLAC
jgi:hypothetical protein